MEIRLPRSRTPGKAVMRSIESMVRTPKRGPRSVSASPCAAHTWSARRTRWAYQMGSGCG